ncbi:MAG: hypothetical protein ACXV3D_00365 [Halobacteriota archaeon]
MKLSSIEAADSSTVTADRSEATIPDLVSSEKAAKVLTRVNWEEENQETLKVMSSLKQGLTDATKQIQRGFMYTAWMYWIMFGTGIALIAASVYYGFSTGESLITGIFGAGGISVVLAFLISKPPRDLEQSRASLAQLQAEFYNWFLDLYNWNTYLGFSYENLQDGVNHAHVDRIHEVVNYTSSSCAKSTEAMLKNTSKYCKISRNPDLEIFKALSNTVSDLKDKVETTTVVKKP